MKLRFAELTVEVGYEAVAAMTAVLLIDRSNRILCCFLAALLHELGHILVMRRRQLRIRAIRLRLFDVLIEADAPPDIRTDYFVTLGGVTMNFLCGALLLPFSEKLALPHFALGIFNLLPVMSLDGGHLLELCLSRRFSPIICRNVLRITTVFFLLPLMTAGLWLLFRSRYNYSLLAISLYLTAILLCKDR